MILHIGQYDDIVSVPSVSHVTDALDFLTSAQNQHILKWIPPSGGSDILYRLDVPFCINIMGGGRYKTKDVFSVTYLSGKESFHLEESAPQADSVRTRMSDIPFHQHDYFELMYVLEGDVEQHIEENCCLYQKGRACLMNRNTRHYEQFGEDYLIVFLCISAEYARDLVEATHCKRDPRQMVDRFLRTNLDPQPQYKKDYIDFLPTRDAAEHEISDKLLEALTQEMLLKQPGYHHVMTGLLIRFFAQLQNPKYFSASHIIADSTRETYIFDEVTRYMEANPGRVSRAELSSHLNYSGDHINRIVKKRSGMSILEYRQFLCLKRAEVMLAESDESIAHIIGQLGFENRTHFYKLFHRKHGITPMEYRKLYRTA